MNGVRITGSPDADPIIPSPYTFAYFEAASCTFACPIPLPWTEWTCHCQSKENQNNNPDNIPKCCGSTRKRFRGCKDEKCNDYANCATTSFHLGGNQPQLRSDLMMNLNIANQTVIDSDKQFAPNCDTEGVQRAQTCENKLPWDTYNIKNVADNQWWNDKWIQGADIRLKSPGNDDYVINNYQNKKDGHMNQATAEKILKETWQNSAMGCGPDSSESCFKTYFGEDNDEFDDFIKKFPSVDLTSLENVFGFKSVSGELNCRKLNDNNSPDFVSIRDELNKLNSTREWDFNDKFTACLFLSLNDNMRRDTSGEHMINIRDALINSDEMVMFLKKNFNDKFQLLNLVYNGNLDFGDIFPTQLNNPWVLSNNALTVESFAVSFLEKLWDQFNNLKGNLNEAKLQRYNQFHPENRTEFIDQRRQKLLDELSDEKSSIISDIVYQVQKNFANLHAKYPVDRMGSNSFKVDFRLTDDDKTWIFVDSSAYEGDEYYNQNLQNIYGIILYIVVLTIQFLIKENEFGTIQEPNTVNGGLRRLMNTATNGIDAMKSTQWIGLLKDDCVFGGECDNEVTPGCKNNFLNTIYQSSDVHAQW